MAPPKCRPAFTTWAMTSLPLHSSAAGRSPKRSPGTASAAARSWSIAARTLSTISAGESFAPCDVR